MISAGSQWLQASHIGIELLEVTTESFRMKSVGSSCESMSLKQALYLHHLTPCNHHTCKYLELVIPNLNFSHVQWINGTIFQAPRFCCHKSHPLVPILSTRWCPRWLERSSIDVTGNSSTNRGATRIEVPRWVVYTENP